MSMLDDLISYWPLGEVSGNAIDAHGTNDLTESSGTIATTTGLVGDCRDFEAGDTEYFSIDSNTGLQTGDIAFSIAAWVNAETLVTYRILGKAGQTTDVEYAIGYSSGSSRFLFRASHDGTTLVDLFANNFGAPDVATWYLIVVWHDPTANTLNIQVNNGTPDSVSHTTGVFAGTTPFRIGATSNPSQYFDGLVDEVAFAKRVWTSDERTWIYNSGAGRSYADWEATETTATIEITSPVQFQAKQRDGSDQADIPVTGTYTGDAPSDVEYQVTPASTGTPSGWIAPTATVGGGTWSFTIADLAADDYLLEVRNADDTDVTDSVDNVLVDDVFLWTGQSNRSGRFTNGQTFSGSVTCSVYDESGAWANLGSNYKDPDESTFSVLPLLATLISDHTGVPCSFICRSTGGTGLVSPDDDWASGGSEFTAAMAAVASSEVNAVKIILWNHGERDAVNDIETAAYAAAESQMLDDMQAAQSALTGVKMVSDCVAGENSGVDATEDQSKIQQAKIYNYDNDADILPGATGHDQDFSDNLHWVSDGQATILANRLWRAIKAAAFSGTEDPRGPRFSSATFDGDTITLELTGGETPIANDTDTTGWAVADDGGARTVSSVSISTRTVTITCDQALVSPVTVSYGRGDAAVGTTTVDGGSLATMPIESFVDKSVSAGGSSSPSGSPSASASSSPSASPSSSPSPSSSASSSPSSSPSPSSSVSSSPSQSPSSSPSPEPPDEDAEEYLQMHLCPRE